MVSKLWILIPILLIGIISYQGVNASTISQYCSGGTCSTGGTISIPVNYTYSTQKIPIIFISYSQTCENMIKAKISGCLPLESIIPYDTSNQNIAGKFIKQGDQITRTKPQIKNFWLYYEQKKDRIVCIECVADITTLQESQNIILQPTDFIYIDKNANVTNGLWSSFNSRYMQGCDTATIANIPGLLQDTITYMLSNCTKTNFNGNSVHKINDTPWQYNNPYSSLLMASSYKSILHGHYLFGNLTGGGLGPSDCIHHVCNITTSSKKW